MIIAVVLDVQGDIVQLLVDVEGCTGSRGPSRGRRGEMKGGVSDYSLQHELLAAFLHHMV